MTDDGGQPLLGANVTIDVLQVSVGTNAQGQYTITIPGARVSGQTVMLRVRAIGFSPIGKSITIRAGAQTADFSLKEDINKLSQVVVTGVTEGTEQKKLAFTVAQVSTADMPVPGANPLTQLQGKVPGANIVSQSGRPGATPSIILRGPQSLDASGRSQSPLLIVDGVITQGSLGDINPEDIDNVEIVKGAAAASLYGSRAGYGVINVTTRTGKTGAEGVRFTTRLETGVSDIEREFPLAEATSLLMDPTRSRYCVALAGNPACARTVDIYNEALRINEGGGDFALTPATFLGDAGISTNLTSSISPACQCRLRGWFQVTRWPVEYHPVAQNVTNGPWMNGNVDMTGKFGRANFFASVGGFRQQGSIRFLDGYRRNSLRLNVDNTLGGNWTLSVRSYYARISQDSSGGAFFRLTRQPGFADLLRTDKYGRMFVRSNPLVQGAQNENPLRTVRYDQQSASSDRYTGSATARWQPLTWMDGEFSFGYDRSNYTNNELRDRGYRITTSTQSTANQGYIGIRDGWGQSYNASMNWTFRKELRSDLLSRLTLRALYEQQDAFGDLQYGVNLVVPGLNTTTAVVPATTTGISSSTNSTRQVGLIAGLNLEWKERYIAEASLRRDGSSLFGVANRWKTYGRGSLAWRASEEKFWPLKDQVNDFKFRASIGQAGNRPSFSQQYETFTINNGTVAASTLGNKNLGPEVSTETELGFDAEIRHKYGINVTRARSIVQDQILSVPPPAASGFSAQWQNAGQLQNDTWEASVNIPILERRDLQYTARVNFDQTRSLITGLATNVAPYFYSAAGQQGTEAMFQIATGERFGTIWGRRMITECSQLPTAYRSRCGNGKEWQKNDNGYVVWVGPGNTWQDGITKNLWQAVLPAASAPFGVIESWGMPMVLRDSAGNALLTKNGSALPDYRWSLAQNFTWRRFSAYALLDAVKGNNIFNIGRAWSFGDFTDKEEDQLGKDVGHAKPMGYYYRVGTPEAAGIGGLYDILGPSSTTVEDASYVKLREVSLGYRFGRVLGYGDWSLSVVGRNLKMWTRYTGFDPEVGVNGGNNGSGALNAVDAYTFPNLRSVTLQLSTSF